LDKLKAVDAAIMNMAAPDKPAGPPKINDKMSTKCQMPTRAGGQKCLRPRKGNQETCGREECAKVWGQIHDPSHSAHPHGTNMRRIR
jgi:hypothetical protein